MEIIGNRRKIFFQNVLDQNPCKQSNLKSILNFDWLQAAILKEVQYALPSQVPRLRCD